MRLFTLDKAAEITTDMFNSYVEHVGLSMMSGEVPSILFSINKRGTKEKDWLAHVRFKNTLAISIFRCDVYLEDVFRLCRQCKMYLITEDIFEVAVLYAMLHPLYQSQYLDFNSVDVNADYESMMAGAGTSAYRFIRDCVPLSTDVQYTALDIFRYYMMLFTNHHGKTTDVLQRYRNAQKAYGNSMHKLYPGAYRAARYRKAQTTLIDKEGYMLLERRTQSKIIS